MPASYADTTYADTSYADTSYADTSYADTSYADTSYANNHHAAGASVHAWSATDHCRRRYGLSIDLKAGLRRDRFREKSASGLCTGQIPPARLQSHWQRSYWI
jgi:hypothetical protein